MTRRLIFFVGTCFALCANGQWRILSSEQYCQAVYETNGVIVELLEDGYTRAVRRDLGMDQEDVKKPILTWHFRGLYDNVMPGEYNRDDIRLHVRLFPDEGQGFVEIKDGRYLEYPEETPYTGIAYEWSGFNWHERFKAWGTAKETTDDEGVRIPEVRLILHFTLPEGALSHNDPEITVWFDVPMWRTSNVMNKLERCSANLIETGQALRVRRGLEEPESEN